MSRYEEGDPDYPNAGDLWDHNLRLALFGRRGQRALADLKAALLALPQKRLIDDKLQCNREVCAVGAYVWWQKVKAGMDPIAAFDAIPEMSGEDETVDWVAAEAGLSRTLIWDLLYRNDDPYARLTPEERYTKFLAWIDENLKVPA
jgi:hypothetical protein